MGRLNYIVYPPCAIPACPTQIVYSSANGNLNGVGVLDSNSASLGTFRGVNGDGTYVTTALDAANKSITVGLVGAAIPALIPQATESVAGKGEVATQAETNAGVSDITFVTPLKLATRAATEVLAGVIEIATQPETFGGSDDARAVTPLKLAQRLATQFVTKVFANAAARAASVPLFEGQVGVQIDTDVAYTSTGLLAGNWQQSYMQVNAVNALTATTTLNADAAVPLRFQAAGTTVFEILDLFTYVRAYSTLQIDSGAFLSVANGGVFNLGSTSAFKVNNASVAINNVLATGGTAGQLVNRPITNFLSAYNTQAWDAPSGTLDRTTFDQSTVTLPELAKRVAALITDLILVKLPTT